MIAASQHRINDVALIKTSDLSPNPPISSLSQKDENRSSSDQRIRCNVPRRISQIRSSRAAILAIERSVTFPRSSHIFSRKLSEGTTCDTAIKETEFHRIPRIDPARIALLDFWRHKNDFRRSSAPRGRTAGLSVGDPPEKGERRREATYHISSSVAEHDGLRCVSRESPGVSARHIRAFTHSRARGLARSLTATAAAVVGDLPFPSSSSSSSFTSSFSIVSSSSSSSWSSRLRRSRARLHSRGLRRAQRTLSSERAPSRPPARDATRVCIPTPPSCRYIAAARFFLDEHSTREHPLYYGPHYHQAPPAHNYDGKTWGKPSAGAPPSHVPPPLLFASSV